MRVIYYTEINIICLIIMAICFNKLKTKNNLISTSKSILRKMVFATEVVCVSDIVAALCRGEMFAYNKIVLYVSNILYIEMILVVAYIWFKYVMYVTGVNPGKTVKYLMDIPFYVFTAVIISTPITKFIFTINDENLYSRGPGIILHWIVAWAYLLVATGFALKAFKNSRTRNEYDMYKPITYFPIAPMFASLFQMIFYGSTVIQAGICISILLIVLQIQNSQLSTDELTGINNRQAFRYYVETFIVKNAKEDTFVMMMDINNFKKINDTLGHTVGDTALKDTAAVLEEACNTISHHLFLCRYGGDEFVIVGKSMTQVLIDELINFIRNSLVEVVEKNQRPYELNLSFGYSTGLCEDEADFKHHLRLADEAMYEDKKKFKNAKV